MTGKFKQILIMALIVLSVGAVWMVKNSQRQARQANLDNTDFALHVVDTLDLEKLKSFKLPIVLDFGADDCPSCLEMAPVLEELNQELRGRVIIKFINVNKYRAIGEDYPIRVLPTQVLIRSDGQPFSPTDPSVYQLTQYTHNDSGKLAFTTHEGGLTKEEFRALLAEMGVK